MSERQTPFYIYSLKSIEKNYQALRAAMPRCVDIYYSLKANPHEAIVKQLEKLGAHFDVSSLKELEVISDPSKCRYVRPAKSKIELVTALKLGGEQIVIESYDELLRLDSYAKELGVVAPILIRVHPNLIHSEARGVIQTSPSQFGVAQDELPHFIEQALKLENINLLGLHVYTQSQLLNESCIVQNFKLVIDDIFIPLGDKITQSFKKINIGGGFGIPYFNDQTPLDLNLIKKEMVALVEPILDKYNNLTLSIESGRFISGPSGLFVTTVIDKKQSKDKSILIVDGGLSNHLAATGFGQVIRKNFKIEKLDDNSKTEDRKPYTIYGPSCYNQDQLAVDVSLPPIEIGDRLIIENSGCYGPTFSPQNFLGLPKALEIIE